MLHMPHFSGTWMEFQTLVGPRTEFKQGLRSFSFVGPESIGGLGPFQTHFFFRNSFWVTSKFSWL